MWCSTEDFEYYLEGLVAGCSGTFFTWTFFSWWCKDNEWFTANRVTKISGCETFGCWINGWADGNWSGWAFWTKSFDFFVQEVTICFEWWIESDTFRIPVIISEKQHRREFQVCFFSVSKWLRIIVFKLVKSNFDRKLHHEQSWVNFQIQQTFNKLSYLKYDRAVN